MPKGRFGFASMDKDLGRQIASLGGRSQGKHCNPGNFANNRKRAKEAGRRGGMTPRRDPAYSSDS